MKAKELRTKTLDELQQACLKAGRELFGLRIQQGINQEVKTHYFRKVRREIARIKTLIREKEGLAS